MTATPQNEARLYPLYRVDADPGTGIWTSEPKLIGERRISERPRDTEDTHHDSFELADGTSCEVDVYWTE